MTTHLKTFSEGNKTFLAVGCIEDRGYSHDESQYYVRDAEGGELYTDDYSEALEFIGKGLVPPKQTWTME